ncbi:MAG: hypothetical protein NXH85_03090 [Pseudomonadaceae bacterium]|nr:hypothetical protein [Pseudomonadaceae bacterium]
MYPDVVVILCTPGERRALASLFNDNPEVQQSLLRATTKTSIATASLKSDGSFGELVYEKNERTDLDLATTPGTGAIYQAGLESVFARRSVLSQSPPGFVFLKMSGERSAYFLRASEALSDTERVHFVACSLLEMLSAREQRANPIEVIYLDTMAIASLAYVLRDLYAELFSKRLKPRVISFHSYEGFADIDRPLPGSSLCLISASSSMNLHRKWIDATRCYEEEAITIVTFSEVANLGKNLWQISAPGGSASQTTHPSVRDLRIVGENFLPDQIPARMVLLTERDHKLSEWAIKGPVYSDGGIFSCHKREGFKSTRGVYVSSSAILDLPDTEIFIEKQLTGKTPISTQLIIYQDDEGSAQLAEKCQQFLKRVSGRTIKSVSASELDAATFADDQAILVVAAVVGRGTELLSISRDLRTRHAGPRHYLILFQVCPEIRDADVLRKNLRFSSTGQQISVSLMDSIAVGTGIAKVFREEHTVLKRLNADAMPRAIAKRLADLDSENGLPEGVFLPVPAEEGAQLVLRPDFAFWEPSYSSSADHGSCVLATVAAMLQRAREHNGFERDEARLSSDALQHVVLDPENFARFNDGIIQAALLKTAHPHELNYTSTPEASARMKSILRQVFTKHEHQQGEASLEFATALASRRLRLSMSDTTDLLAMCRDQLAGDGDWESLILTILGLMTDNKSGEAPF